MAKARSVYACTECGGESPKWQGQCPHCGAWNTLVEGVAESTPRNRFSGVTKSSELKRLAEVSARDAPRMASGMEELDRVLGGGFVAGEVVLIGGDPGVGKSTLLLQVLARMSGSHKVVYVSGEESAEQIALRARRLALDSGKLELLAEIQLERILATLEKAKPEIAVVDSIQTLYSEQLTSAPGSVAQVRECVAHLARYAKSRGTVVVLVGHVTKEGAIAGPRVVEHIVDAVLYFEGDTHQSFRLIRAFKNRFGAPAGGADPQCGHGWLRSGVVGEGGGRSPHQGARRRPRGTPRHRLLARRQAAAGEARGVRRSRPRGRGAPGAARPGAVEGGRQARLHPGDHPQGQSAEAENRRARDHRRRAGRGRDRAFPAIKFVPDKDTPCK